MIALGLGTHNFTASYCLEKYKTICEKGLVSKPLTKTYFIGFFARFFTSSIYKTEPLEAALQDVYGRKKLFGYQGNATRVAITTTVDADTRLFANFNSGDGKAYLNSNIHTWAA